MTKVLLSQPSRPASHNSSRAMVNRPGNPG
ncbi:hypothetical protein, partial [Escherichia coli]